MNTVINWFARNGVAANLTMIVIIAAGLLTIPAVKQEIFPELSADVITVTVPYPGASPGETEDGICVRIEEQIQGIEGVKQIISTAGEGFGMVVVELLPDADVRRALDEIKARVDGIDTFPVEAEAPVVAEVIIRRQVLNVAVHGKTDERTLKRLAEQVRDEISGLPGITQLELANVRPYEISVEVSEEALRRHGLTFEEVARAVRRSSLDLPGGSIRTEGGEILLRTRGQAYRGPDFERLVLLTRPDGTRLLLGEVARVVDGFAETDQSARFDGEPTALIQVFRVGRQSALEVSETIQGYLQEAQYRMPEGVSLTIWQDDSEVLRSRIDLLLRNGRAGLILVLIVLALFLQVRVAFWVSLAIPISFLGTFWLMPTLDVSINMLSLFAFIIALGIVVDATIVVGENIYSKVQAGIPSLQAAVEGAREMSVPVVFGVLTTVAAFSPLMMVEGNTGKVLAMIPLVVVPTILFSLVVSLLVLPAQLSRLRRNPKRGLWTPLGLWSAFQGIFAQGLEGFIHRVYRPGLRFALDWRYFTVACGLAVLLLTVGMVAGGKIAFRFFPPVEADNMVALLTMPQGVPVEQTQDAIRRLEETAQLIRAEVDAASPQGSPSIFRHLLSSVGEQPFRRAQQHGPGGQAVGQAGGGHLGEVNIQLLPSEERGVSAGDLANRWREKTGPIPDAVELVFTTALFSTGEPINVRLGGPRFPQLVEAAEELKARLGEYPGVYDIRDSFRAGKQELQLSILPSAESLGLSLADLARQVRQAFFGEEAQRIQRGRDDVRVMVRYPEPQRRSLGDLENMRIRAADGAAVPFSAVAEAQLGRGFASIRRVDRQRSVNVTAEVDTGRANPNAILAELESGFLRELTARYPGLTYSFEGEQREQQESLAGLMEGFILALLMIYALLAVPLRSYFQPLLIMSAIPFGLVGAVWGHYLLGLELTILSMFGVVALAGVVVNSALVLVHYVNESRRAGMEMEEAVREAGVARFRPILLTTLTTFAGLTPLLMERSLQAQFLIPMAVSLGYGVLFSTFISLALVPAGYLILEDLKRLFGSLLGRETVPERTTA